MPAVDRLYYMDNLRALAMFAGVLFHAALAYSPLAHPFVPTADRAQSIALDTVIWFLHLFRMPLFFVVAGFFAAMLVAKRGLAGLFRNRLRRIALPFMVCWPLVHATLSWSTLHAAAAVKNPSPLLVLIQDFSQTEGLTAQLPGTAHLWFLYYLMFFYLLIWSAQNFELEKLGNCLRKLGPAWHLGVLPLLLVPALAAVSAPNPAPENPFPQFWAFGYYGPFFAAGYLLYGHEALIERLRAVVPWLLTASLLFYAAFWVLLKRHTPSAEDPSASISIAVLEAYISVWMTCSCLVTGRLCLNRSHALLRYLADASYWIYLVHLPVLFAIQYGLMDLNWPWGSKFATAVLATLGICLLSYHGLVRATVLRKVLGQARPDTSPSPGAV